MDFVPTRRSLLLANHSFIVSLILEVNDINKTYVKT